MHLRPCIAAAAAVMLLLFGPAVAQADHTLSVSKSEAAAGDEVEFQISGTQAGESYILKVEDREVASGVDSGGNGVTDKFKMPDFGNSNQSVSVEVRITPSNGDPDHLGVLPTPMQYVSAFSGAPPEQPAAQPQPAVTVPAPAVVPRQETPRTPRPSRRPTPERENPRGNGNANGKNNGNGNGNDGGSPASSNTPSTVPSSTPSSTSTGSGSGDTPSSNSSSTGASTPTVPPGPSGPNAPVGSSIASALSPLSGLAEPGKTGFPVLLILLLVLVAATVLTAIGPRLWQRWEPALPWGPEVDDEVRLGALGRASASGAELQQTIAARRATRSAGRAL